MTLKPLLLALYMASIQWVMAQHPNVVLIMADDVSWEAFSCYRAQNFKTPNIDQLTRDGVRYKHCYSTPLL